MACIKNNCRLLYFIILARIQIPMLENNGKEDISLYPYLGLNLD